MAKIKRAILSVSNKKGLLEFAKELSAMGVEILSTGGTARALREGGIPVKDVSEHTGFPEMLDGRVKTLHPKIHGGLLSRRKNPKDMEEIEKHGIVPIDMVVVNLYPFEETIAKPDVTFEDAIENIDIGGPTMLRSASKNFQDVAVIVDPADYAPVIKEMKERNGELAYKRKMELAKKVFGHTSRYDALITEYLAKVIREGSE
jgi:phosphoribosylaminoimidazolecarboxamide formyltransferase/IMP cyclohydrolase